MTQSIPQHNGRVKYLLDALWWVPAEYYDLYRGWYGRLHRNMSWMAFERGQLLVIGPAQRGSQEMSGTPCLFDKPADGWAMNKPGYYSWVYDRWCRPQCVLTYRLTPIEVCDPIYKLKWFWLAKTYLEPLDPLPQKSWSSFTKELRSGRISWQSLVREELERRRVNRF